MPTDLLDELARLGTAIERLATPIDRIEVGPSPRAVQTRETSQTTGSYVADCSIRSSARTRRFVATIAAAAITAAGLALAAASRRQPSAPLHASTPDASNTSEVNRTTVAETTEPSQSTTSVAGPTVGAAPALFDAARRPLDVQVVEPGGTFTRSGVGSLAAGPGGFVATGTGFERGSNPGRLWFSPDGRRWTEPDVGMFAELDVGPVVATPSWYLVRASTRGATEFESGVLRWYRSADGVSWESVPASVTADPAVAVGSQFVRTSTSGVEMSDDAVDWQPVDNPSLQGVTITSASASAGRVYAVVVPTSGGQLTQAFAGTSVADLRPTAAPNDGTVGSLAAVPGGVVAVANDMATCLPSTDVQRGPGAAAGPRCGRHQIVRFLPAGDSTWRVLTEQGPTTDDLWHPVQSFGNQLMQFVTGPDRHLTVALSADGVTWTAVPDVDVDLLDGLDPRDAGSPDIAQVATRDDVVVAVIVTANAPGIAGMRSRLVVGTVTG